MMKNCLSETGFELGTFQSKDCRSADWAIEAMRNLPKKLYFIYIIENVTVSLLPYIPLSAWKEFHYFSCEGSTCAKESVGIEKSSIFDFDRGHQSRIRGLLRVKVLAFWSQWRYHYQIQITRPLYHKNQILKC